jgi:transposase
LDIHKNRISVATTAARRSGKSRSHGTIGNTSEQIRKLAAKLTQRHGVIHFVYKAGPTGYVHWRTLIEAGYACAVTGPAQIPKKPGNRVKTDRRDDLQFARLDRAGELEAVPTIRVSRLSPIGATTSRSRDRLQPLALRPRAPHIRMYATDLMLIYKWRKQP